MNFTITFNVVDNTLAPVSNVTAVINQNSSVIIQNGQFVVNTQFPQIVIQILVDTSVIFNKSFDSAVAN